MLVELVTDVLTLDGCYVLMSHLLVKVLSGLVVSKFGI